MELEGGGERSKRFLIQFVSFFALSLFFFFSFFSLCVCVCFFFLGIFFSGYLIIYTISGEEKGKRIYGFAVNGNFKWICLLFFVV